MHLKTIKLFVLPLANLIAALPHLEPNLVDPRKSVIGYRRVSAAEAASINEAKAPVYDANLANGHKLIGAGVYVVNDAKAIISKKKPGHEWICIFYANLNTIHKLMKVWISKVPGAPNPTEEEIWTLIKKYDKDADPARALRFAVNGVWQDAYFLLIPPAIVVDKSIGWEGQCFQTLEELPYKEDVMWNKWTTNVYGTVPELKKKEGVVAAR